METPRLKREQPGRYALRGYVLENGDVIIGSRKIRVDLFKDKPIEVEIQKHRVAIEIEKE